MKGWDGIHKRCRGRKKGKMGAEKGKRRAEKVEGENQKRKAGCRSPLLREGELCPTMLKERRPGVESHLKHPATHTYILVDTSQSLAHAIEQATCISASLNSNPVGLLTRTYFSLLW